MSFSHLHVHTEYSMLDGYSQHDELAAEVARLGQPAVAMTDHGNMFGSYSFYQAMTKANVKPIIGVEAYVAPKHRRHKQAVFWGPGGKRAAKDSDGESGDVSGGGAYLHQTLLARDALGLHQLYELTGRASIEGQYPKPKGRIDRELLTEVIGRDGQHIIATTGCPGGEVQTRLRLGQYHEAREAAGFYRDLFGRENYFVEVMDHGLGVEKQTRAGLLRLAKELGIRPLATNDSHYVHEHQAEAHDALLCIGTGKNIADRDRFKFDGDHYFIKSAEQMRALFDGEIPGACDNTLLVADMVGSYESVFAYRNRMPRFPVPEGHTEESWLRHLVYQGLRERYGDTLPEAVLARAEFELDLILRMGFAGYFLVVHGICEFMRSRGIRFGPRGSAAGSIVVYGLGIAALDPIEHELMFERFINPDRISPPDIDIDIDEARRDEVIRYIVDTYGEERVSQIITFGRIKAKNALKDAARILNHGYAVGDRISKAMPPDVVGRSMPLAGCFDKAHDRYAEAQAVRDLRTSDPAVAEAIEYGLKVESRVRATGKHACGVILSAEPLLGQVPLHLSIPKESSGDPATLLAGHEYPDLEAMGLQKMDLLGLRNWTVVDKTIAQVRQRHGVEVDLAGMSAFDDPAVYELLGRGETLGLFQVEGGPMQSLLRAMKPTKFEDIMAVIALYRPGPMGANAHNLYADRKNGRAEIIPIHPELADPLRDILAPTYGVICFQEQVIKIAQKLAGYSLGRADLLRKAMGKKKPEVLAKEFEPFRDGMRANDYSDEAVQVLWDTLLPFADYAFGRAHSACYAALVYYTAWLKAHHPTEYMANLLGSVGDDKAKLAIYLAESRRMGITVLQPDINASGAAFTPVEDRRIRFGLGSIRDVGSGVVEAILAERQAAPYASFLDYAGRVASAGCTSKAMMALIQAGAFDSFGIARRALAQSCDAVVDAAASAKKREEKEGAFTLFSSLTDDGAEQLGMAGVSIDESVIEWSKADRLSFERDRLGLYVSGHPLDDAEAVLAAYRAIRLIDLTTSERDEGDVHVSGMMTDVVRRATKAGAQMATFTLEDLGGTFRCVVFPKTYEVIESAIAADAIVSVKGRLNRRDADEVNIIVDKILPLNLQDGELPVVLQMARHKASAALFDELRELLQRHPGSRPARITLRGSDGHSEQYALPGFAVATTAAFQSEVKALLGRECLQS